MKKLVLAVAALGLISLTSCKKEYTCECTISGIKTSTTSGKMKKADAKTWCDNANTAAKTGGGSCALK